MGILIAVLYYALISFIMYKTLENEKIVLTFIMNIVFLLGYYILNNGMTHIFAYVIASIINGCVFSFIGLYLYRKETQLNRFLGAAVLTELGLSFAINFVLISILL